MADRRYEIEIFTTASGTGAATVSGELAATAAQAEVTRSALEGLDRAHESTDASAKTVAGSLKEVANSTESAGQKATDANDPFDDLRKQFQGTKQELDTLDRKLKEAPGSVTNLEEKLASLAGAAGKLSLVLAAWKIGSELGKQLSDMVETVGRMVDPATRAADQFERIKTNAEALAKVKVSQIAGELDSIEKRAASMFKEIDRRNSIESAPRSAKAGADIAELRLQQQRDLFAAKGPEEAEAITAVADMRERQIQSAERLESIQAELNAASDKLFAARQAQAAAEEKLRPVTEDVERELQNYKEYLRELQKMGFSRSDLSTPEAISQAERNTKNGVFGAALGGENSEALTLLAGLKNILAQQPAVQDALANESIAEEIKGFADAVEQAKSDYSVVSDELRKAVADAQRAQIDSSLQLQQAVNAIDRRIGELIQNRQQTEQQMYTAQGAGDSNAQNAAFGELQATDARISDLNRLKQQLVDAISSFGADAQAAADAAARAISSGKDAMIGAAEVVKGQAVVVAQDFTNAASVVTAATGAAQKSVVGSIEALGASIQAGFNQVNTTLSTVVDRINAQEARLTAVAAKAASAEATAQIAAAQAAANR